MFWKQRKHKEKIWHFYVLDANNCLISSIYLAKNEETIIDIAENYLGCYLDVESITKDKIKNITKHKMFLDSEEWYINMKPSPINPENLVWEYKAMISVNWVY